MRLVNNMRNYFLKFSITAALFLSIAFAPLTVLATSAADNLLEGVGKTAEQAGISENTKKDPTDNLAKMLGRMLNYMFGIVGTVFVIIILIGGYKWMAGGGNEEGIKEAKTFILNGVFGLIVIFTSYALVIAILYAVSLSNALAK